MDWFKFLKFTIISTTSAQSTTKAIQIKFITKHKFEQNKMLSNQENIKKTTKQYFFFNVKHQMPFKDKTQKSFIEIWFKKIERKNDSQNKGS